MSNLIFCSKLVTFWCLRATFPYGNLPEFKNAIALFSMLVLGKGLEKSQPRDMSLSAPTALASAQEVTRSEKTHHVFTSPKGC